MNNKELHESFVEKIHKIRIPCISIGLVTKKDNIPKFLEVIIKRPERYSNFKLIKNSIPKTYKGVKVKIL